MKEKLAAAWAWLKKNTWVAWTSLGLLVALVLRYLSRGRVAEQVAQERANNEWERMASHAEGVVSATEVRETEALHTADALKEKREELKAEAATLGTQHVDVENMDAAQLVQAWNEKAGK